MRRARAVLCSLWLGISSLSSIPARASQLPRASEVVEPHAYASLEPVPRGRAFELAVVAKIRPGFHINAHEVSQDYLIPTQLETQLPPGLRDLGTVYPRAALRAFSFSPVKLSVYENSVTLRMRLQAAPDAPLGAQKLNLTLHYQACNQEACLPPVKLPVTAELEIAPAGTAARPAHPEVFQEPAQSRTRPSR